MRSSEKTYLVSQGIGSVEDDDVDPLDDLFLVEVLEILETIDEFLKNTNNKVLKKDSREDDRQKA